MAYKIIDKRREAALLDALEPGGGAGSAAARAGLSALSAAYGAAVSRRTKKHSKAKQAETAAAIISVGNITVGGTGKTPVCMYLADALSARGITTGISTRGYGRRSGEARFFTRHDANAAWSDTGDEPLLYLRRGHVEAVAVDPDRARGAAGLASDFGCRAVLLDDGFQFISLRKDRNIVTLDAVSPFGNGRLIPRGPLREPVDALSRADTFWLTRAGGDNSAAAASTAEMLAAKFPGVPIVVSGHSPECLYPAQSSAGGGALPLTHISKANTAALSGIGNPAAFERDVEALSGELKLALRFTDHHPFTAAELREAEDAAAREGCGAIITTEKDEIRIPDEFEPQMEWLVLKIGITVLGGTEHVEQILADCARTA